MRRDDRRARLRTLVAGALAALLAAGCSADGPARSSSDGGTSPPGAGPARLAVSENQRFFVDDAGRPFFWLADTAWSMPVNLDRDEVIDYLDTRAGQGFTVIQTVAIFPQARGPGPNRYGDRPFRGGLSDLSITEGRDPAEPADPARYDYWDHLDFIIAAATARGLRVGLLPVWADQQVGDLVTEQNAGAYGEFLGARYADDQVVWVLGGDESADGVEDVWRALARGIAIGATGTEDHHVTMMTYHPIGDMSSARWFHDDDWLAFNMIQGGHCLRYDVRQKLIDTTYRERPAKPFLDGEPIYSDHPYCWDRPPKGYSTPLDVRRDAYWSVFAGAAGHTYGHHAVWQFLSERRPAQLGARGEWRSALDDPAAGQMRHLRALMESRPYQTGEPDQGVVESGAGSGATRIQATRAADGAYLMAYVPDGRAFIVDLGELSGDAARAWWFDPRSGAATEIGTVAAASLAVTPPSSEDWVFVADDAARGFGAPGA